MNQGPPITPQLIAQAHALFGQWTGQSVSLRFDRERAWFEWFRAGFTLQDLQRVVRYLQREIREGRRNVGALKLSNLLQLDRFEEDLNISRVRLVTSLQPVSAPTSPRPRLSPEQQRRRQLAFVQLQRLKQTLK